MRPSSTVPGLLRDPALPTVIAVVALTLALALTLK
jgi:hypothetical protein